MKNILVVGGAGYIGAHIVDLLCETNSNVIVFDNLSNGYVENLNSKSIFVEGDILNRNNIESVFRNYKVDIVIHMAAKKAAGESINKVSKYTENNVIGSFNLINSCIDFGIKDFIFSSTAAVYGNPVKDLIDEQHPLAPINHYGYTKLMVENYLSWISKIRKFRYIALRYFNAAGYTFNSKIIKKKEKNPQNLLPIVLEVANKSRPKIEVFGDDYDTEDGTCIRDYIHVLDLAQAHLKAIDYLNDKKVSNIFNLSTGSGSSVLEVINISKRITKQNIEYNISPKREGDPPILMSSYKKANKLLDWSPQYDIEDIIKSMWSIYS